MLRAIGFFVFLCIAIIAAEDCYSQEESKSTIPPGGVIRKEIDRLGDRVGVVGERDMRPIGAMSQPGYFPNGGLAFESNYTNAMSTPADDSDQWLLALWGPSNDPTTQQWFKAFESDEHLTPFVAPDPSNSGKAWAHWNFYRADDGTQLWRFRDYKIDPSAMPCITLNPPRNGHFGNPVIVVDRFELKTMNPASVQKRIQRSVKAWTDNLQVSAQPPTKDGSGSQWNSLQQNPYGSQVQSATDYWNQQISQCRPNDLNCPMNRIPPAQPFDPKFPTNGPGGGGVMYFLERNAGLLLVAALLAVIIALYLKNNPDMLKNTKPQNPTPAATPADLQRQIDALKAAAEAAAIPKP